MDYDSYRRWIYRGRLDHELSADEQSAVNSGSGHGGSCDELTDWLKRVLGGEVLAEGVHERRQAIRLSSAYVFAATFAVAIGAYLLGMHCKRMELTPEQRTERRLRLQSAQRRVVALEKGAALQKYADGELEPVEQAPCVDPQCVGETCKVGAHRRTFVLRKRPNAAVAPPPKKKGAAAAEGAGTEIDTGAGAGAAAGAADEQEHERDKAVLEAYLAGELDRDLSQISLRQRAFLWLRSSPEFMSLMSAAGTLPFFAAMFSPCGELGCVLGSVVGSGGF